MLMEEARTLGLVYGVKNGILTSRNLEEYLALVSNRLYVMKNIDDSVKKGRMIKQGISRTEYFFYQFLDILLRAVPRRVVMVVEGERYALISCVDFLLMIPMKRFPSENDVMTLKELEKRSNGIFTFPKEIKMEKALALLKEKFGKDVYTVDGMLENDLAEKYGIRVRETNGENDLRLTYGRAKLIMKAITKSSSMKYINTEKDAKEVAGLCMPRCRERAKSHVCNAFHIPLPEALRKKVEEIKNKRNKDYVNNRR